MFFKINELYILQVYLPGPYYLYLILSVVQGICHDLLCNKLLSSQMIVHCNSLFSLGNSVH